MAQHPFLWGTWRGRLLVGSFLVLLIAAGAFAVLPALAGPAAASPGSPPPVQVRHPDVISQAVKSDTSPALRDIPPLRYGMSKWEDHDNPAIRNVAAAKKGIDSVIQSALSPLVMPTPIQNFEGQYNQNGPIPPDTNGDVGRNHYLQIVNSTFQIWSKTGTSLYGPVNNNTLFTGFGGVCETRNDGDPVALYDALADRWVLTWFTSSAPYMECIAVSTSPDPLGSWYRYAFNDANPGTTLGDYPKMAVWPDAYYMSTNEFGPTNGDGNYAYDRAKMLRGDPTAQLVYFHGTDGGKLPSDVDSAGAPPPAGSPNYFIEWYNPSPGQLAEFKFHVDFTTPANSTYTGPFLISVADFDPNPPGVPEPGTTTQLDNLSDRLMYRLAYRNMGSYEALVVNHTVNVVYSGVNYNGIRWYELRNPNGPSGATVFQQGTYEPNDGVHRWMGSIAMDRSGDIAMGFSASSSTVYPNIRYAGRLVGDPAGQMSQGEATLFLGVGSEDYPSAARWGDYSAIQVDPADDCTFWYTTLYWGPTGLRDWRTRIGSFKFPSCVPSGSPTAVATATGAVPTATNTPGPSPTFCPGSISATGSITNTDPTQTGRLGLGGPVSSCAVPKTVAGLSDNLTRHYDSYTYTNSTGNPQCVTVSITQACGNNAVQSVAYLGSFNPASPQANYLADGAAAGPSFSYSFSLGAGQTAVVVVLETSPNLGCATYNIAINPCAAGAVTPTSTPAGTSTPTPVITPSATPTTVCTGTTYQTFPSTGATMIPATNDIGNHCDDCATLINLPFPVTVYGQVYTSTRAGSNGLLNFGSSQAAAYQNNCLPVQSNNPQFASTLFPYYDDLRTDVMTNTHGIYTATLGAAPNRQFVLRWQTTYYVDDTLDANFEVILNENSPTINVIYGQTATIAQGAAPASGIQLNLGQYTAYSCQTDLPAGLQVDYVPIGCGVTPSPTPAPPTPTGTSTPMATATETPCPINFTDVPTEYWAYGYIKWAACHGIISGYADGTFHPDASITRAQITKMITLASGWTLLNPAQAHFTDVSPGYWAYSYIETAYAHNVISGYADGTFRPGVNVTRAQIAKIVVLARTYPLVNPTTPTFTDVPPSYWAYTYIETAYANAVIGGYDCLRLTPTPSPEPGPCREFRPANLATRAQFSKMLFQSVALATPTPGP